MATDVYTADANQEVYKSSLVNGGKVISVVASYTATEALKSGDIVRMFKSIDSNLIPLELTISTTGGYTANVGLYYPQGGPVIDADALAAGLTSASAAVRNVDAMAAVSVPNMKKNLAELVNVDAAIYPALDVALTLGASLAKDATVVLKGTFLQKG